MAPSRGGQFVHGKGHRATPPATFSNIQDIDQGLERTQRQELKVGRRPAVNSRGRRLRPERNLAEPGGSEGRDLGLGPLEEELLVLAEGARSNLMLGALLVTMEDVVPHLPHPAIELMLVGDDATPLAQDREAGGSLGPQHPEAGRQAPIARPSSPSWLPLWRGSAP